MNYIAERRQEEKERRRAEILDAAEAVASVVGWDDMTMDQVARKARLSRALVYVYFQDKTDLMYGIAQRALVVLKQRFTEAVERNQRGINQVEAMGRAYLAFSQEFPLYFEIMARCELLSPDGMDPATNEGICVICGDAVHDLIVGALNTGIRDGSIRPDVGEPEVIGVVLWGFMHGLIQVATKKANVLTHRGIQFNALLEQALVLATRSVAAQE